jgi:hypothetical protein
MRALIAAVAAAVLLCAAAGSWAADLPSILRSEAVKTVGPSRTVVAATVVCPKGATASACRVSAPRTVAVRLRGKRYAVRIRTPKLRAGKTGDVTARLSRALVKRLAGRTATIKFLMSVGKNRAAIAQKVTA